MADPPETNMSELCDGEKFCDTEFDGSVCVPVSLGLLKMFDFDAEGPIAGGSVLRSSSLIVSTSVVFDFDLLIQKVQ